MTPRINGGLFSSNSNEWATPKAFFQSLDAEFHFDLDPCATAENAKCRDFYTIESNGLTKDWGGAESVLQSAIRPGDRQVGCKKFRRVEETEHVGRHAHTGKDGHRLLPRLHLQKSKGNQIHPGTAAFQRKQTGCALSLDGRNILTI